MAEGELERGQQVIQELIEADDRKSEAIDIEMVRNDGERVVLAVNFVVLQTADGAYDGVMGIARDVTERRERERTLERQNERLEKFASVVSHDLRNPLNVAAGRLELARAEVDNEDLAIVADAHDQMRALIDDLLALAREGEQASDVRPVDLAATAEACWQNVATDDASLETDSSMRIRADRRRLTRLLENLFRNAVEHGGDAPTVVVGPLDDRDGFYVADDGPGVPADSSQLFDAGYSTNPDGTGFGLSIVQDVVDAHDWAVAVTESAEGGARFELSGVEVVER
jgi:signal transduction histidine kinase